MNIRPVDRVIPPLEPALPDNREQSRQRQPNPKKQKVPGAPVYKPNGEVDEEPPPKIDVLV